MAHGGDPDGMSSDGRSSEGESISLSDLSYPPYEDETESDHESWWDRIRGDIGTPVPEYDDPPFYES